MKKCFFLFLTFILAIGRIGCENVNESTESIDESSAVSREEFESLKETFSRFQNKAGNQIVQLQSELNCQRSIIQDLQTTILQQAKEMKQVKRSSVANPLQRKRNADSTVAFFATLTQTSLDHLGLHQNIVFEDVVTNFGNAYNNHQGVFVAPVSGLYLITTSVLSRQDKEFWADVVVNGTLIVRLNGRGTDGRHGTGTQTIVMTLKRGDDVSIQNANQNDDYWGQKYSSFGGFLIQELETEPTIIG